MRLGRHNLSQWFQDNSIAAAQKKLLGALPSEIIPNLYAVGAVEPLEGWAEHLAGRNWKFWGQRIAKPGVWVGAIELEAMNELLLNAGYDVRVNIYDSRSKRLLGNDRNVPNQLVLILYMKNGHFELLLPINQAK